MKIPPGGRLCYMLTHAKSGAEAHADDPCKVQFIVFNHDEHPVFLSKHYTFKAVQNAMAFVHAQFPDATEFVQEQP